jgi:hypothetical protein
VQVRVKELMKLWQLMLLQMGSPWQNIKQTAFKLLAKFFSFPMVKSPHFKKLIELIKPLLNNLLASPDASEREGGLLVCGSVLGFAGPGFESKATALQHLRSQSHLLKEQM